MRYYKFLTEHNTGGYSDFVYPVKPDGSTKWLTCDGPLRMCDNGFHLAPENNLVPFIQSQLFLAEYTGDILEDWGEILDDDEKICCRKIRLIRKIESWDEKAQRLFAADCAEHVLHIFEAEFPNDKRPRETIAAVRAYARGEITSAELWVAARATAARAAAARAAADATYAAAYAAERKWQNERILEYIKEN